MRRRRVPVLRPLVRSSWLWGTCLTFICCSPSRWALGRCIIRHWLRVRIHPGLRGILLFSESRFVVCWRCAPVVCIRLCQQACAWFGWGCSPNKGKRKNGVLEANRQYAARAVVCAVAMAEQCSLARPVAYMHLLPQADPEAVDPRPVLSIGLDVYDVDLDVEGEWYLSDIKPSGETDVCSSLQSDFPVIRNKCVEYSVEEPMTADGVFKLPIRGLYTFEKRRDLSAGVDQVHCTIRSLKAQIQSLQCQVSSPRAELESVQSKVGCLGGSLDGVDRQLSVSRAAFIWAEFMRDKSQALLTLKRKSVKIWWRYCWKFCVVSTIIRLFSLQVMKYFVMTSIGLCMNTWRLFLTLWSNVLVPFALCPQVR